MKSPERKREWSPEDRLALLTRVMRELTAGLDLVGVLRRALGLSVQAVDAAFGSLLLLDERERPALAIGLRGGKFRPLDDIDQCRRMLQDGLAGWVVENREAAVVPNTDTDSRWLPAPKESRNREMRSALCVPLLHPRRVVGVLTCTHPEVGYFSEEDLETVQLVADQAAVALENARLFAAEERRRELANTLSEIARIITATLDLDEVLNLILEQLGRVIPYDTASVFLLQDQRLTIRAWRGFENPDGVGSISFDVEGEHIMARVVSHREPMVYADVQQEAGWEDLPGVPSPRSWIGAPLGARGEVVGTLIVCSHETSVYGEADAQLVGAFADHAAVAVGNAWLWQQIQRRLEEVAFLHETGRALTASLELDDVLHSLMGSVREHFGVEAASAALLNEETGELIFRAATGAAADEVVGMQLEPGQGIAGWVADSGEPTLVSSVRGDPRFFRGVDEVTGFGTEGIMAVPIQLGEQTIGVIEAINPRKGYPDEDDLKLLMNVSVLAASAIRNARHFNRARDAEQRYASLFENSADPILITDASGSITDVNLKLCEMLSYEKEELLGRHIASLPEEPEATRERLAQALEGGSIFYNVELAARDGTPVPFEVRANRVFHGSRPYVQWVCHDLSERLELEQARDDLTHMIIHDLRNPLSSIMSSLDLIHAAMTDKSITIPVNELFRIAQRSGDRLYLLIDSILDLARLEDGGAGLTRRRLDVRSLVIEAVQQARPTTTARQLHMECRIPTELPPLWADRDLLARVLQNLLDNAIKFTPSRGEIVVRVDQPDAESLLFVISDTGLGIPPDQQEHIFDRFARVRREEGEGAGLGLALCKLAVEAHGGRIWVESEPDQGSTFKFILPLGEEEATS